MSGLSNYGFEVQINGEHLCNAGIDTDRHVVTCILTSLRRLNESDGLDLTVSGLNSVTDENLKWVDKELKEGDTITIKVITTDFEPARQIKQKPSKEKMR
ncbi:hypothetical protein [Dyadobacter sp. CY326]|uniref:hypothetical protein n=1 Tax=Dyadobacter sp. CY326 TaxID=2907300 RepID=UPI001F1EFEF2|nr:hypothetical protein [Dyadobacter sp. CY326]MCE7065258.1 hypothetical protein [Dyadobacter sp. CY326]